MARPNAHPSRPAVWWGDDVLDEGACGHWRIGPYEFWLARSEHDWRFAGRVDVDATDAVSLERRVPAPDAMPESGVELRRLGFRRTAAALRLQPRLADRSVVIRPAQPISLPPRQELVLYFSTPAWLQILVDDPLVRFLEVPMQRPSDTWFGPNTREGELCYSLRTSARLRVEDLPQRPHRVQTELHVINSADESLDVDRIQVPLPLMSLYATVGGQLWTQVVTMERRDGDHAGLELGEGPPAHAADAELLAGPRSLASRADLFRAFGGLIGGW